MRSRTFFRVVLLLKVIALFVLSAAQPTTAMSDTIIDLGQYISPIDINAFGVVANQGGPPGFLRDTGSGYTKTDIGILPGGNAPNSRGTGINASHQIVGYTYFTGGPRAILWTDSNNNWVRDTGPPDEMKSLGFLTGGDRSQAEDINNAGKVVGWSDVAVYSHAFIWEDDAGGGTMTDLGTFGKSSVAEGINNLDHVVGYSSPSSGAPKGFFAEEVGGSWMMKDLGTLGRDSYASGINSSGQVVGNSTLLSWENHAFVAENVGGSWMMTDLNDRLPLGSVWDYLSSAQAINDDGWIVGTGYIDNKSHGFLMEYTPIPEPTTLLLLGSGLLGLGLARRRKHTV